MDDATAKIRSANRAARTQKALKEAVVTLPNAISLTRLLLAPVIIWLITAGADVLAFVLFLAAMIGDALDGFLARRLGVETHIGAYLDPVADKVLVVSLYTTLTLAGPIPAWLAIAVISRDLLFVGGVMLTWIALGRWWFPPLWIGKIATFSQLSLIVIVLGLPLLAAGGPVFEEAGQAAMIAGIYAAGILTLLSGGAYAARWLVRVANWEKTAAPREP